MKTTLTALIIVLLTGCSSTCREACLFGVWGPGSASFDAVALHYDTQDACQYTGKPLGYQLPNYCGAGKRTSKITDRWGHTVGYVK